MSLTLAVGRIWICEKKCIVIDESSRLKRTRSVTNFFLESSLTSICKWKVNWHQFEPLWSWRSPSEGRSRRLSKRRRTLECDRTISLTVDARRLKRDEYLWNFLKRRKRGPHVRTDLIWNTCARWEASWFLVSMYLIWILESILIRSNNQSSATLWVLETCLIVGLLPLIIILITASLSSNTYNKASWREDWTFEGTESMSFIT